MKTLILILSLSLTAQAETLKNYRKSYGISQDQLDYIEKSAQIRIANIREAMGYKNLRLSAPMWKLQSVTRTQTSSLYLKGLLSRTGSGFKSYETTEKPATMDPSLFGAEINDRVREQKMAYCVKVLGAPPKTPQREYLINQLYGQATAPSTRQDNVAADVRNGYNSDISNAIVGYIKANGQQEILDKLGQIYQIEAIDGMISRIRFTRTPKDMSWMNNQPKLPFGWPQKEQPKWPNVVMEDKDSLSLSLEMLATMVSDYDRFFLMGSSCLVNLVDDEEAKVAKEYRDIVDSFLYKYTCQGCAIAKQDRVKLGKLQAIQRYLRGKHEGAIHAHNELAKLTRKQLFFLLDMFMQFRGDEIPASKDIANLNFLASKVQKPVKPGEPLLPVTIDHLYYSNLEEELFRVEDYVREYKRNDAMNTALINEIKGLPVNTPKTKRGGK